MWEGAWPSTPEKKSVGRGGADYPREVGDGPDYYKKATKTDVTMLHEA